MLSYAACVLICLCIGLYLLIECFVWRNVFTQLNVHRSTASVMKEMLRIKSRQAEIPGFSSSDVDFILECLCVS